MSYADPFRHITLCRPGCVCLHYTPFCYAHQTKRPVLVVLRVMESSSSDDSSPFLDRVRAACRRKGYTYRTEKTYLRWIVRYVKYHGTEHPREFGKVELLLAAIGWEAFAEPGSKSQDADSESEQRPQVSAASWHLDR